jgi:isopentenyl-diphosphate delta-isomerase
MSAETARACWGAGVRAIDIGDGRDIMACRGSLQGEQSTAQAGEGLVSLGAIFEDWGIPTAVSCAKSRHRGPIIATGGIRTGSIWPCPGTRR